MDDLDALLQDLESTRTQLKENRGKNIQDINDSPYSYPRGALSPQTPVSPIYSEIPNGFSPSPSPTGHPNSHPYSVQRAESEPLYETQDIQLPLSARVYSETARTNTFTQQLPVYDLDYKPNTPTSPLPPVPVVPAPHTNNHQQAPSHSQPAPTNAAPPKPARSRPNGRQPPPTLPKPQIFRYDKAATSSYQNSTYQSTNPAPAPAPVPGPANAPVRMAGLPVSELDSLLLELEQAQSQIQNSSTPPPKPPPPSSGMVKPPRTNMGGGGGGGGGGVSDLNDMLDDLVGTVTPSSYTVESTRTYTQHSQPPPPQPKPQPQQQPITRVVTNNVHAPPPAQPHISQPPLRTASSATKELDDLMASLSDFQLSPTETNHSMSAPQEPAYAQPHKVMPPPKPAHPPPNTVNVHNAPPPTQPKPQVQPQPQPQAQPQQAPPPPQNYAPSQPSQLDSMLGHLHSDVSRQGVQTVAKGICAACQKPIVGQIVTALGQTWHSEHFVCAKCQRELGTQTFFERSGEAYCEEDYHNLFAPKCAYCHGPIKDKCVTALDKTWHPEHFFCAQCGKTFGEDGFHEKNGKPYCREDYFDMFAPRCGGCNRAIMENFITALNAQWHPECFVCADCRVPFNEGDFFDHDGVPYCEIHYHAVRGSLCAGCNKPITGRCITAMQRKFHPEHFVCDYCLKQLNKGTFKEQSGKAYCHSCFVKLFN